MNKNRFINIILSNFLKECDIDDVIYTKNNILTFKRFITSLPDDIINPSNRLYRHKNGIGIQFSWHFTTAIIAIAEDKIYVEKLDNDHDCRTRDTWFEFKEGYSIPKVILDFFNEHFSIRTMGLEKYFERRRWELNFDSKHRRETEEFEKSISHLSPEEKIIAWIRRPILRELLYENIPRNLVEIKIL